MDLKANNGKNIEIKVDNETYNRYAIKTRFVKEGEDYIQIINEYIKPVYQDGDVVSISEKIIALCQGRTIKRDEIKVGFWAKLLSKFASHPTTGVGVGEAIKMQYAINTVGLPKVIYASIVSAITKIFGKKGKFYEIVGQEVSGLDGFYGKVWDEYADLGIKIPENPKGVCNEINEKLGIKTMIVDANDLGQEILGTCQELDGKEEKLKQIIRDNPAGQGRECTPLILIRKKAIPEGI